MKTFKDIREACWKGYKQVGTKNKGGKDVPNCVPEENENYNQDLTLATKNVARLAKKETGQDKKDYQAVSRALAQGNLGAVKKVIKGISTKEIQADILNILVGYNDLIAKMYPKAVDKNGNLKSGLNVDKLIKESIEEAKKIQDIARKYKRELQKAVKTGQLELSDKATRELERWAVDAGEIRGKEEDEFIDWLDKNLDDLASGKLREGRYTANDGGAFDGLRIAKYLAHEDGKSWRKLKYGEIEGYLQDASDLLKNNKSKARSILAKPTPRD